MASEEEKLNSVPVVQGDRPIESLEAMKAQIVELVNRDPSQISSLLRGQVAGLVGFADRLQRAGETTPEFQAELTLRGELTTFLLDRGLSTCPDVVRAAIWPVAGRSEVGFQGLTDTVFSDPRARMPNNEILPNGQFSYWGETAILDNLPSDRGPFTAVEIAIGYVAVIDKDGQPVGVVDLHPYWKLQEYSDVLVGDELKKTKSPSFRDEITADSGEGCHTREPLSPESRTILVKREEVVRHPRMVSPEETFQQMFGREINASRDEIDDFLADYDRFFSQDGEFAIQSGLAKSINLNAVPIEAKFSIWRFFQGESSLENRASAYRFFRNNDTYSGPLFSAFVDRPGLVSPFIRIANRAVSEYGHSYYFDALVTFANREQILDISRLTPELDPFLVIESARRMAEEVLPEDLESFLPELFGWITKVEGFSTEMAVSMMEKDQRRPENAEFIFELSVAIQERARVMVAVLVDWLDKETNFVQGGFGSLSQDQLEVVRMVRDAGRAQRLLVSFLATKGLDGFAEAVNLPPYFFQEYRKAHLGNPEAGEMMDLILELWEGVYRGKEKARGEDKTVAKVREFWARNESQVTKGEQTGDRATEVARDVAVIERLVAEEKLAEEVSVIDFGCWTGKRRLRPLLNMLRRTGRKISRVVGIDISDVPDQIPELELNQMEFAEVAHAPGLESRFHLAKCDWSAANDAAAITEQLLNFAGFSRSLRRGGVFILDTAFPEGKGSYDQVLRDLKAAYPWLPEGSHLFKYDTTEGDAKIFLLYYYEILTKFFEDAGFEIMNLPKGWEKRRAYFQAAIAGEADISKGKKNPFKCPIWEAKGRPRITIVARKVREVEATRNPVLMLELLGRRWPAQTIEGQLKKAA